MSKKVTLTIFYGAIALICVLIVMLSRYLHHKNESSGKMPAPSTQVINSGKEKPAEWFAIEEDLVATNQEGKEVRLSDLKGKVWLAANFFAVCPMCAQRNGAELHKIYETFGSDPDFQIVCISVDPENDDVERLKAYGAALNADPANWWFLNAGSEEKTHRYLEDELKFFGIRERKDPVDIEANGRFAHDLGFILVDRDFRVVGKWPLADARSPDAVKRQPGLYDALKKDLFERIRTELDKGKDLSDTP